MENDKELKLDDMKDLRDHLRTAFLKAVQGKSDEMQVRALIGLANQIQKGIMVELHYANMNRIKPKIEFLKNVEQSA